MAAENRAFVAWVAALSGAALAILVRAAGFRLTYNTTGSLPVWIYRIERLDGDPRRGDVVGFCLDRETAGIALARGYVHPEGLEPFVYGTRCPGGVAVIGKPVAGLPGDMMWGRRGCGSTERS